MVKDKADNTNNRFGVASEINRRLTGGPFPFWGCPPRDTLTTLQPKRTRDHGPGDLPELRHAEVAAKGASSIWKLYYNGSVGGQAILGIPVVRRLKLARGEAMKIWPFETGFKALDEADLDGVDVVAGEVYPSLVKTQPMPGEVKDQAQVRATAEHFARLDEAGKLGALFGPRPRPRPPIWWSTRRPKKAGSSVRRSRPAGPCRAQHPEPAQQQPGRKQAGDDRRPDQAVDAKVHADRQDPGRRDHDADIADEVGDARNQDVASRPQALGRNHLQCVRDQEETGQNQRRRRHRPSQGVAGVACAIRAAVGQTTRVTTSPKAAVTPMLTPAARLTPRVCGRHRRCRPSRRTRPRGPAGP